MSDAECARRPWHQGETAAQRLAAARALSPVIRLSMTEPLRQFFSQLSLLFLASVDAAGFPSATFLRGAPGFVTYSATGRPVAVAICLAASSSAALASG